MKKKCAYLTTANKIDQMYYILNIIIRILTIVHYSELKYTIVYYIKNKKVPEGMNVMGPKKCLTSLYLNYPPVHDTSPRVRSLYSTYLWIIGFDVCICK